MDNEERLKNLRENFKSAIDDEIVRYNEIIQLVDSETNKITRLYESATSTKEKAAAQIKLLEEQKKAIDNGDYEIKAGIITGTLEKQIEKKDNIVESLGDQINALEERKANEDLSDSEISIIDSQISYKKKMIEKLNKKKTKLSNRQKSIVMKKVKLREFRNRMIANQQIRVAKNENKVDTIEAKQEALGDSAIAALRENGLEVKKSFHSWKAGFDRDVLEKLQKSRITGIAGARAIAIGKVALDRLRGRATGRVQTTMDSMMPPQPQVQTATTNTL